MTARPFPCPSDARDRSLCRLPAVLVVSLGICLGGAGGCARKPAPDAPAPTFTDAIKTLERVVQSGVVDSEVLAMRPALEEAVTAGKLPGDKIMPLVDKLIAAGTGVSGPQEAVVKQRAKELLAIVKAAAPAP